MRHQTLYSFGQIRPMNNARNIINQTYNLYGLTIRLDSHFTIFRLYQMHFTTQHLTFIVRYDVTYRYWIVLFISKFFLELTW